MMLVPFSKSPNVGEMYHLVNVTKHAGIISVNMFINVSCYSHQFLCTLSSPGGREAVQSQSTWSSGSSNTQTRVIIQTQTGEDNQSPNHSLWTDRTSQYQSGLLACWRTSGPFGGQRGNLWGNFLDKLEQLICKY